MDEGAISAMLPDDGGPPPEAYMRGPLSRPAAPGPATQYMTDLSRGLIGDDPKGALSRLDSLQQGMDSAAAEKARRIQSAMGILQAARMDQSTNLPMAAFGAGLMAPTRTGSLGEAISAGTSAMIPAVQAQRQQDMSYALGQGKLGIEASDVDIQRAQDAAKDFYKRLELAQSAARPAVTAETWGQRSDDAYRRATDVATIRTDAMKDVAGIKDGAQREIALAKIYMQKLGLDEKTAHNRATEDLGMQRNNTTLAGSILRSQATQRGQDTSVLLKQMGIDAKTASDASKAPDTYAKLADRIEQTIIKTPEGASMSPQERRLLVEKRLAQAGVTKPQAQSRAAAPDIRAGLGEDGTPAEKPPLDKIFAP